MADRVEDRPSLKDLDGVRVAIEGRVPPPFTAERLKAAIEARLRAAGIRIQGMGEFPTGDPHLNLTVVRADRDGTAAVDVQLDFRQIVFLRRNPAQTFNRAQTWKADATLVFAPAGQIEAAVQSELLRQVDQFIADYGAVNNAR